MTEALYTNMNEGNRKFIPVLLDGFSSDDIPDLQLPFGRTYYRWPQDDEMLYRRLTGQPVALPAKLGDVIVLDPHL